MNKDNIEHALAENEGTILHKALEALAAIAPLEYVVEPADCPGDHEYDYLVRGKQLGKKFVWCIELKNRLTRTGEMQLLMSKDKVPHSLLLVTGYVPPEAAERLRGIGIQFIDKAGNMFINQPPVLIFVKGNKAEKEKITLPDTRLFKGVGLKIVYILLCRPELANRPYRDLANMTGVALGTVNAVMTELIMKGFILDMGKRGKKILNRKKLFERWITAYPDYLKPKLLLGRFRGEEYWWNKTDLDPAIAQWGGEVAAARITGYLKPGTALLYTEKKFLADLVVTNRLKKDPQGNVEIFERFWPMDYGFGDLDTAHPIIIYADLLATGDQRTTETAKMIYKQYLDQYFRQD
ncbi:MAG: hypothetical protein HGB20_09225 [Chlorobiaceae bacterium]|nr:hypothetical protein [Chlorobiaceae bacterium]